MFTTTLTSLASIVRPVTPVKLAPPTLAITLVHERASVSLFSLHSAIARFTPVRLRPILPKPTNAVTFAKPIVSRLASETSTFSFVSPEMYKSCPVFFSTPKLPFTVTMSKTLTSAVPVTFM